MSSDYRLLTVREAHDLTNLPIKTLYRLAERGEVQSRRDGRTIYLRRASLIAWVEGGEQPWSPPEHQPKVVPMQRAQMRGEFDGTRV